jgi:hypothetical protein
VKPLCKIVEVDDQRIRFLAKQRFIADRKLCYQRAIRDTYAAVTSEPQIPNLSGATVRAVTKEQAEQIILKYEWLGSLGRARAFYGLFCGEEFVGVTCFGLPTAIQSRDICGQEYRDRAISLLRGACTHRAPKNAASFLISRSCRLAHEHYGWSIFYAYADQDAGEIGNVYQASNWYYIGQGVGRTPGRLREEWILPDGKQVSSRYLRHRGLKLKDAVALGWKRVFTLPKHKYVWFEGNRRERKQLAKLCRYPFLPYPKDRERPLVAPLLDSPERIA